MVRTSAMEWHIGDDHFIEVMHALTYPDESWSYPQRPDVLTSLDELIAWTNDSRGYDDRIHKSGWTSAINDFIEATGSLGSNVLSKLQPHINIVRSISQAGVSSDPQKRATLSAEAATMRRILADTDTLAAAWTDLLRACGRRETPMNTVAVRRDIFWAIVRASDRNVDELSSELVSVLTGDLAITHFATPKVGEIEKSDTDLRTLRDALPTPPLKRLERAERILRAEPTKKHHIVWLAFRNAYSDRISEKLGFIQLFDAQWLHGNLFGDGPFKDELPEELWQLDNANSIPNHHGVVLARVDLGTGVFSNAIREAGERTDTLLGIATIRCQVPWERMHGFIHVQDSQIATEQFFRYREEPQPFYAMHDTAAQISHLAPRVASALPVRHSDIRGIIEALHWWTAGRDQPTAASIVLNVRAIELVSSRLGETSWTTYLEKHIKELWIYTSLVNKLYFPLHEALHHRVSAEAHAIQRNIFLDATEHIDGQQTFNVRTAASNLNTIIEFIPSILPLGRELRTVRHRTSNTSAIQAWLSELERLWKGSVHRLERVRNSIAHGGPFTEHTVELVHPFSRQLSIWALETSIEGYLDGKTLSRTHIELKEKWENWRSSVHDATSVTDIFGDI